MENSRITNNAMKTITEHPLTEFLVRCLLAAIFLAASLSKINAITDFAHSILNYKLFSWHFALIVATILPWLELLCSFSLLLGIYQRAATIILLFLLSVFTLLVLWTLIIGLDISCGCFTQDPQASRIGWLKVVENCGLLLLAIFLLVRSGSSWTVFTLIEHTSQKPSANDQSDDTSH